MNDKKIVSSYDEVLKPKEDKVNNDQKQSTIVKNFPSWDLLPPYQTVRRITRK